jgi:hypothetical protein
MMIRVYLADKWKTKIKSDLTHSRISLRKRKLHDIKLEFHYIRLHYNASKN